jgi:hypothetical protein
MRSAFACSSSVFFPSNFSSNHRPRYCPLLTPKSAKTSKYVLGTKARIFSSRSARIVRVGVCTRPAVVFKNPPPRELKAVSARVELMPTSQSASLRDMAASASGSISASLRSD